MPELRRLRRLRSELGRRAVARSRTARRLTFRARWTSTRRLDPLTEWGYERGQPVDRWYIHRYLTGNPAPLHGTVLEVKEDLYASVLGAERVDVLDIDAGNPLATVIGDVCAPVTLEPDRYDAAIVTQTLQLVPDPAQALANLKRSLRPGGVLLVTVPCMSRSAGPSDRWRWTPLGFLELAESVGLRGEVSGVGNVLACRAFLLGAAVEDLDKSLLTRADPACPLLVTAALR